MCLSPQPQFPLSHLERPALHPFLLQVSLLSHRLPAQLLWVSGERINRALGGTAPTPAPALAGWSPAQGGQSSKALGDLQVAGGWGGAPDGAAGLPTVPLSRVCVTSTY